jgi:hypothetical protein
MPISKIAVASSPYGVGGESGAGLRPASDSALGGHPGDAASLGGTAGLRPTSLTGAKRSRLRYRREERARAKLGSRPWPVVGSFVPIQAEQSGAGRDGPSLRGTTRPDTSRSRGTSDLDHDDQRDYRHGHRVPALPDRVPAEPRERGRSPRSPAGGWRSGSIRSGMTGIGGRRIFSSREEHFYPPNSGVSGGVGSSYIYKPFAPEQVRHLASSHQCRRCQPAGDQRWS